MFKKRVIWFFVVLLTIALLIVTIRFSQFGSLTGEIISLDSEDLNDVNSSNTDKVSSNEKQTALAHFGPYIGYMLLVFLILFFTIRFIYRFHQRINRKNEKPYEKNFIVIEGDKKSALWNV